MKGEGVSAVSCGVGMSYTVHTVGKYKPVTCVSLTKRKI